MKKMLFRDFPLNVRIAIVLLAAAWTLEILSDVVLFGRISLFSVSFAFMFVVLSFSMHRVARWGCVAANVFMVCLLAVRLAELAEVFPSILFFTTLFDLAMFFLSSLCFLRGPATRDLA